MCVHPSIIIPNKTTSHPPPINLSCINQPTKQTLSAFEGRGGGEAARMDFLAGLETEENDNDNDEEPTTAAGAATAGAGAHAHSKPHHHGHGHGKPPAKPKKKAAHQHASLGFESIGLEIRDGPLDWGLLENWLYDQVCMYV